MKIILKQEKRQNVIKQKIGKEQSKHIESKDLKKMKALWVYCQLLCLQRYYKKLDLTLKKR